MKKFDSSKRTMPMSRFFIALSYFLPLFFRWRPVGVEDGTEFQWLEQEAVTNSSGTRHTIDNLQPYTVYTFSVRAINTVGRSVASKQSYPAVTLMESEYNSGKRDQGRKGARCLNPAAVTASSGRPMITLTGLFVPFGARSTVHGFLGLNCLCLSHKDDTGSSSSLLSRPILLSRAHCTRPSTTLISCIPFLHRILHSKLSVDRFGSDQPRFALFTASRHPFAGPSQEQGSLTATS